MHQPYRQVVVLVATVIDLSEHRAQRQETTGDPFLSPTGEVALCRARDDGLSEIAALFVGSAASAFARSESAEQFKQRTLATPQAASMLFAVARDLLTLQDGRRWSEPDRRWPWQENQSV